MVSRVVEDNWTVKKTIRSSEVDGVVIPSILGGIDEYTDFPTFGGKIPKGKINVVHDVIVTIIRGVRITSDGRS